MTFLVEMRNLYQVLRPKVREIYILAQLGPFWPQLTSFGPFVPLLVLFCPYLGIFEQSQSSEKYEINMKQPLKHGISD